MNILLVGGSGSLINHLIIKLNKEGHRIYLLTGNVYKQEPYQRVFERYDFTYDCTCLKEIFESVKPDVTIYMGAFDTNYYQNDNLMKEVDYFSGLMNLLMAYATCNDGGFFYLSSDEVYAGHYEEDISEEEPPAPNGATGMVLAQGEQLCKSYRLYQKKEIVILRLDHLYSIPKKRSEVRSICAKMCLEALEYGTVTIVKKNQFSLLYETDAVEYIYRIITAEKRQHFLYNLTSPVVNSEQEIAEMVQKAFKKKTAIVSADKAGGRRVLSGVRMDSEFGKPFCCEVNKMVHKIAVCMEKDSYAFTENLNQKETFLGRIKRKSAWLMKTLLPVLENIFCFVGVCFLKFYMEKKGISIELDFFLLYVLLFAIVYGQQQATTAAILSLIGQCTLQLSAGWEIGMILNAQTYIWLAQLFILGLSVGYMKDQLIIADKEKEAEKKFLSRQISDMQDINESNVRVKDALQVQIINQNDSVGKIYGITSTLEQYSPEEVLFYAAEILSKLMNTKDVAVYIVSNADYARLFAYTSQKAKELGNSLRYRELEDMYQALMEKRVFINRKLDERYPLMANAVWESEKMEVLLFVWGLSWENMTLGQANQLAIISSLIQNAVVRAKRYLSAIENQYYVGNSRMLATEAFERLAKAYMQAQKKGLTECTFLKILTEKENHTSAGALLASKLRQTDFVGTTAAGGLYALIVNTPKKDVPFVINRFKELGYDVEIMENGIE